MEREIFESQFEVFSNFICYSGEEDLILGCAFTRIETNETDNAVVASVMAHSLSDFNWIATFEKLNTFRLVGTIVPLNSAS